MRKHTKALLCGAATMMASTVFAQALPSLPEPVTNNAVAKVSNDQGTYFLSFMGLARNKTAADVHNKVWALKLGDEQWQDMRPVPASTELKGRLAATAVGVGKYAYVFGGYTVSEDHTEISVPDVYRFDVSQNDYTRLADMPVPVDDSIALNYQNKFIYLISGWHNDGNVNLVQVYNIKEDSWTQASPFLGDPVFGQAGAIVGKVMVICDGVKTQAYPDKRRGFEAKAQCLKGTIDSQDPTRIDWRAISHPTGKAHYRMAAGSHQGKLIFMAGSSNPYNYNGIGYNKKPSPPSSQVWHFDLETNRWQRMAHAQKATMDHRGLLSEGDYIYRIGGMGEKQKVLDDVTGYAVKASL